LIYSLSWRKWDTRLPWGWITPPTAIGLDVGQDQLFQGGGMLAPQAPLAHEAFQDSHQGKRRPLLAKVRLIDEGLHEHPLP